MRALWSQERASLEGKTVSFRDVFLRPQPPGGTIPVHIGGHSEIAAHRAGRIGDGFFPFGVDRSELPQLVDMMNRAAKTAGRDASSLELTVSSYSIDEDAAVAEVRALEALGATRIVLPAALFQGDPHISLMRYGEQVIGRF
jgi:alkanesulfonate monooxygenase SsuD/methylene tetrahydromethanopterin reductase-like flavin-dependent oxidoreductase (luciferase family)